MRKISCNMMLDRWLPGPTGAAAAGVCEARRACAWGSEKLRVSRKLGSSAAARDARWHGDAAARAYAR